MEHYDETNLRALAETCNNLIQEGVEIPSDLSIIILGLYRTLSRFLEKGENDE